MSAPGGRPPNWRKLRDFPKERPRLAFLDFDGTLSLLRAGWLPIMRGQMFRALRPLGDSESDGELKAKIECWIQENNGKPTWRQMERLHLEIKRRNGASQGWESHLEEFTDLLMQRVNPLKRQLRERLLDPTAVCMPGAHTLLEQLGDNGLELHLVSGTTLEHVLEEADLLGLAPFFDNRIHAPGPENPQFSKEQVLVSLVPDPAERANVLAIGDGPVEITLVSRNGGLAIGVARSEDHDGIDPEIGTLLERCGAHGLVPDFTQAREFTEWVLSCPGEQPSIPYHPGPA